MQAMEVLRDVKAASGASAYEMAHLSGVSEATVSRILSGKTHPSFATVQRILTPLGYELAPRKVELHVHTHAVAQLISAIHEYAGTAEQWEQISARMREIIEFTPECPLALSRALARIDSRQWKAFLAGLYVIQGWAQMNQCQGMRLAEEWTPLPRIRASSTELHPVFAELNVLIPRGELEVL